ncbi:LacI family DNA-binding transcriptional regulator [Meinhardsimonia xiamenensis]|uniref:LacI family DNA-binding transcriptional regulator n=1 Tax=Meinhardsimonia xiamenensis TaxID=990712 RepID=UPI000B839796|nr:substrate-binding domain-containing protein [Meinhardsimonia xiamenensis]
MNLKELARTLGLSQTTVSRALNGYPEVAEATRARVLEAARRYNYVPNARARGLATGRSMAIAHVLPISDSHELVNPVFTDFIAGASEIYLRHGYDMVLKLVADDEQERTYREIAARGTADGIIVHAPHTGDPRIALLHELRLPFVVHGRASRGRDDDYSWVDINNLRAFAHATDFLLDLGHRRIGLINGLVSMDFARRREEGFRQALGARGIAPDETLITSGEMTESYGYRTARAFLERERPATAILCSSMIIAIGVRRAIHELGLEMGRDVSVITHDDELSYLRNAGEVPMFTATRSSVRMAGRLCAEMLIESIANPDAPPRHRLLDAALTVGASTGPAPAD